MSVLPDRPLTWVFAGDSITQGAYHTHGMRTWFELAFERIRYQCGRLDDVMLNTGVSGWTTAMVEERYDWLIGRFRPDVLSVSLGTNDASRDPMRFTPPGQFETRLIAMIERARADGSECVLLHTPALIAHSAYAERPGFDEYAPAVRSAASATGALLIDHDQAWRERWGEAEPLEWLNDPIHPNQLGHRRMADTLLTTLGLGAYDDNAR